MKEQLVTLLSLINFKNAFKAALAASLSWIVVTWYAPIMFHRPNTLISGVWCVITAVIVLQANIGGTFKAALNRFFGTFIGSLIGIIVTASLGSDPYTLALGIFLTVVLCFFFKLEDSYRIACASTAVVIILWKMNPAVNPWAFGFFRFIDATIGIMIALLISHFVFPAHATKSMKKNIAEILQDFKKVLQMILNLEPEDPYHRQEFRSISLEILNDLQKTRKTLEESQPEMVVKSSSFDEWKLTLSDLDRLFENISDLEAVYHPKTQEIMTPELIACIQTLFDRIYQAMDVLAQALKTDSDPVDFPELQHDLLAFSEELLIFRAQHRMRNYGFTEVENFFVFTHSIKSILNLLMTMEGRLKKINLDDEEIHFSKLLPWNAPQSKPSSTHSES